MSQQIREQLSALMDGELPKDETAFLLRRVAHDRALLQQWSSYHVCRQVLRRQDLMALPTDFADAVLARLADEPPQRPSRNGRVLQWVSGGAIAASVAVFALMFSGPREPGNDSVEQPLAAVPASTTPSARGGSMSRRARSFAGRCRHNESDPAGPRYRPPRSPGSWLERGPAFSESHSRNSVMRPSARIRDLLFEPGTFGGPDHGLLL